MVNIKQHATEKANNNQCWVVTSNDTSWRYFL